MPTTKLTPEQLAQKMTNDQLIAELQKPTTLNVYKQEASKRMLAMSQIVATQNTKEVPKPTVTPAVQPTTTKPTTDNNTPQTQTISSQELKDWQIKMEQQALKREEVENLKKYTINKIQIVSSFDLRSSSDGEDSTYFPDLQTVIKVSDQDIRQKDNQIKTLILKEADSITTKQLTPKNRLVWSKYNKLPDIVYLEKQRVYTTESNVDEVIKNVPTASNMDSIEQIEENIRVYKEKVGNLALPIYPDTVNNIFNLDIFTGKTKKFTIKWLGSVLNDGIGQFEITKIE
jgi:hypothetical protein